MELVKIDPVLAGECVPTNYQLEDVNHNWFQIPIYFYIRFKKLGRTGSNEINFFAFSIIQATQVDVRAAQVAQDEVSS